MTSEEILVIAQAELSFQKGEFLSPYPKDSWEHELFIKELGNYSLNWIQPHGIEQKTKKAVFKTDHGTAPVPAHSCMVLGICR